MQNIVALHPHNSVSSFEEAAIRHFRIISVEFKILIPDSLFVRFTGKGGFVLKKITDETGTQISISDPRQYFATDPGRDPVKERIITIKANTLEAALEAEKRISYRLSQDCDIDLNPGMNYNYQPAPTYAMATPIDGLTASIPQYISANVHPISGECAYNNQPFNPIPIAMNATPIYYQAAHAPPGYSINPQPIIAQQLPSSPPIHIKSRIYIPDGIVGALIGPKGQNIRNMMQITGAIIHIEGDRYDSHKKNKISRSSQQNGENLKKSESESKENETDEVFEDAAEKLKNLKTSPDKNSNQRLSRPHSSTDANNNARGTPPNAGISNNQHYRRNGSDGSSERGICITGYDYQVYKAQYLIFQRVAESSNQFPDDLILQCEAIVPTKVIGRIIGRGGQNVKQMQQMAHASVKIPDEISQADKNRAETPVRITGNFYSLQIVQSRIGAMIADTELKESREYEGKRSRNSSSKPVAGNGGCSAATTASNANNKNSALVGGGGLPVPTPTSTTNVTANSTIVGGNTLVAAAPSGVVQIQMTTHKITSGGGNGGLEHQQQQPATLMVPTGSPVVAQSGGVGSACQNVQM